MGKPDQGSAFGGGSSEGDRRRRRCPAVAADCQWGGSARWSLRLLRGEDVSSRCRSAVTITAARASQCGATAFLAAGQTSLKSRQPDARNEDDRRLQAKIGELLMENE